MDPANALDIFNFSGVDPEPTSEPCMWNGTDFDMFVKTFPNDYRPNLFRGLYLAFFGKLKQQYIPQAASELTRAARKSQESALPPYFLGQVFDRAAFFLSPVPEAERDGYRKRALVAYGQAILLPS